MQLEEEVVYPAMKPVTGQEEVEGSRLSTSWRVVRWPRCWILTPDEPGFQAALETTKAAIEHHVQDEEGEVSPRCARSEGVLADMATPFMRRRLELGLPVRPDAPRSRLKQGRAPRGGKVGGSRGRGVDDQGRTRQGALRPYDVLITPVPSSGHRALNPHYGSLIPGSAQRRFAGGDGRPPEE